MKDSFLTMEQMHERLLEYYKERYEERDTDHMIESMAHNIMIFERDGERIGLQCSIRGEVTELP